MRETKFAVKELERNQHAGKASARTRDIIVRRSAFMTVEVIFVVVAIFASTIQIASIWVSFPILTGSGAPSPLSTTRCSSHNCAFCPHMPGVH